MADDLVGGLTEVSQHDTGETAKGEPLQWVIDLAGRCADRINAQAAEIARLRVHEHELGEIVAQDRARPGWREGVEAAAAALDESAATLEEDAPGSITASTMARIYREKATAIRALKEPT